MFALLLYYFDSKNNMFYCMRITSNHLSLLISHLKRMGENISTVAFYEMYYCEKTKSIRLKDPQEPESLRPGSVLSDQLHPTILSKAGRLNVSTCELQQCPTLHDLCKE